MNKRILLLLMLVFLTFIAACKPEVSDRTDVKSVLVDPPKGNGHFTLTVTYQAAGSSGSFSAESIDCYYATLGGNTVRFDPITPPNYSKKGETLSSEISFEETVSGEYTATCENTGATSQASAKFTVAISTRLTGKGQRIVYSDEYSCTVPVDLIFIVQDDGSALLSSVGTNIVDHINCTSGGFDETWNMEGTANPAVETASFGSCNDGGFEATGSVQYSDAVISGSVTCTWIKGDDAGSVAVKLITP